MLSRLFLALLFLQTPKPGSLSGTVANSVTGAPVRKAHVTLQSGPDTFTTTTGADGTFSVAELKPNNYFVRVEAAGFQPSGQNEPIHVAEDQHVDNLAIKLTPLGVITGRVLDENGEPLARMTVEARIEVFGNKGRVMNTAGQTTSDDRGQYRIFDMSPGRYSVMVYRGPLPPGALSGARGRLRDDQIQTAYVTTWFPGVTDPSQAAMNVLAPGSELTLDVRLRKVPVFHIRGSANAAGGFVNVGVCGGPLAPSMNIPILRDGTFDAPGVVRGAWCLSVNQMTDNTRGAFGHQTVNVADHDVNQVDIAVMPTVELRGQILIDGAAPTKFQSIPLRLEPVTENGRTVGVGSQPDGAFTIPNVPPEAYRVVLSGFGFYLKSARFNGQDAADGRIVVPPGGGQLTLLVNTDSGEIGGTAQAGTYLTVVSASTGEVAARSFTPPGGNFLLRGLAPGDYQVLAWETRETGLAEYPELRKQFLSRAAAATVAAKGHATVELKPITAAEIEDAKGRLR